MRVLGFQIPFTTKALVTDEEILAALGYGSATSTGVSVTRDVALRVPAVKAAVTTISEAAASLDVKVVALAADGTETDMPGHPVATLLRAGPNDWTSTFELVRALVIDALVRNEGGLAWVNWSNGSPVEIIRYEPGRIAAERDKDGTGEPSYRINGRPTDRQNILHLRGPFDVCPVTLAAEAIAVAVVMEKHAARLFGHGAKPGGVIETDKSVGDTGVLKMLAGWKAAHEGADAAAKTAILWDGAKWRQMTLSSVDAQFQELRVFQLQEIGRAFNIPAVMLGELSRATWSNSAEMQRMFLLLCLEPWLCALESAFTRALFLKADRATHAVRFVRDDFSKVDLAVLATAINSLIASRVINPNTGAAWLGLPPHEGGEEYSNPNTGASQPGAPGSDETQASDDEETDGSE